MTSSQQAQLAEYFSSIVFTPFKDLAVHPELQLFTIHSPQEFSKPIIELSKALEKDRAQITEVSTSGSIQDLSVINNSESYLLIYEGSLLKGAKQNRVVNATLLLPPMSKNRIPASCIEMGRWRSTSAKFAISDYDAPQFLRKTLRQEISSKRDLKGDQSKVWEEIDKYSAKKKVSNDSSDFDDIYNRSQKQELLFPHGLQLSPSQGVFLQAKGEYTMDFVASQETFSHIQSRLIKGYEYPIKEKRSSLTNENPAEIITKWIEEGTLFAQPSAAWGTDIRIQTPHCLISILIALDEVVSMSITPSL